MSRLTSSELKNLVWTRHPDSRNRMAVAEFRNSRRSANPVSPTTLNTCSSVITTRPAGSRNDCMLVPRACILPSSAQLVVGPVFIFIVTAILVSFEQHSDPVPQGAHKKQAARYRSQRHLQQECSSPWIGVGFSLNRQ